jgi:hypothetical protein
VTEVGEGAGIAGDAAAALNHDCSVPLDALRQLNAPIESVYLAGKSIARVQIGGFCRADRTAGEMALRRAALQAAEGFPDIEAESGIER